MNLVDSSGWLSFFVDSKNAEDFFTPLKDTAHLIVPTIVMYEVFKVILREKGENAAILAQAQMQEASVVEFTARLAVKAAEISVKFRLPMADSIIYSTAIAYNATLWTQDEHFKGMEKVRYFAVSNQ
jgi:predicted nucleic acid-binding protein